MRLFLTLRLPCMMAPIICCTGKCCWRYCIASLLLREVASWSNVIYLNGIDSIAASNELNLALSL